MIEPAGTHVTLREPNGETFYDVSNPFGHYRIASVPPTPGISRSNFGMRIIQMRRYTVSWAARKLEAAISVS